MKNSVKRLLALVMTCAMLSVCALAADFTSCADELHDLGLFQGTGTDANGNPEYSLDTAPTRAQAVTMLVRLLGKETEAQEGTWDVPFTDLDGANAWALPYVGYAYANGLTNGESDTLFGTNNACSSQMYCTLVLRALGYDDAAGDFTYDNALTFATEKGLLDSFLTSGEFLRDEVAAISYAALVTPMNGSETLLVEKLVEEGAVDATGAQALIDKANLYAEYCALNASVENQAESIDMTTTMNMTMSMADVQVPMTVEANQKVALTEEGFEMATTTAVTAMGTPQNVEVYVVDGVMYTNDGTNKVKAPYTAVDDMLGMAQLSSAAASPLYYISDITKTEAEDGAVTYTVTMSGELLSSLTESVMAAMGQSQDMAGVAMGNVTMSMTYVDDVLTSLAATMPMSVTAEGQTVDMDIELTAVINAMGDDVVIEFPEDLDTYVEMPATETDAPIADQAE